MLANDTYIQQIKDNLSEINPYLILLFGSYAYGTPDEDSDIDLLVVTNDDFIPQSFKEHSKIYLSVSKLLRPVNKDFAIDLIVHTKPMFQKFIVQDSSFAHEILTKGIKIYERDHAPMA